MLCMKVSKTLIKMKKDGITLHADHKAAIKVSKMIVQIGMEYTVKIDKGPHK